MILEEVRQHARWYRPTQHVRRELLKAPTSVAVPAGTFTMIAEERRL